MFETRRSYKWLNWIAWGSVLGLASILGLRAEANSPTIKRAVWTGVDLRDVEQYAHASFPEAKAMLDAFTARPADFFPAGVTFRREGPGISRARAGRSKRRTNTVYGIEVQQGPVSLGDSRLEYELTATIHSQERGMFIRRMLVEVITTDPAAVTHVRILEDTPLSQTRFSIRVSLVARKAILVEPNLGIRKIYPLGVGSFDEGVTPESEGRVELLTPLFSDARLSRERGTWQARQTPAYFHGMPFMKITRSDGVTTPIAFHIVQHAEAAPGGTDFNYMRRMFDSHGCMRLREKDLFELYEILMNGELPETSVDVSYWIDDPLEHPLPTIDDRYQRVRNFGTAARPESRRRAEKEGDPKLLVTHVVRSAPPIHLLQARDGDEMPTQAFEEEYADSSADPSAGEPLLAEQTP